MLVTDTMKKHLADIADIIGSDHRLAAAAAANNDSPKIIVLTLIMKLYFYQKSQLIRPPLYSSL